MPTNRVYNIAVIPATVSARRSCRRACACSKPRPRNSALNCARIIRLRLVRLLRQARAHDAGGLEGENRLARCDLLRRGRLAGQNSRPHSLWGSLIQFRREFDQYVNLRPVRLMPGCRRRWPIANPATSISGWCARTPRRIFLDRRPHLSRHRARSGDAGNRVHPHRRRPRAEICF